MEEMLKPFIGHRCQDQVMINRDQTYSLSLNQKQQKEHVKSNIKLFMYSKTQKLSVSLSAGIHVSKNKNLQHRKTYKYIYT